MKLNWGHALIAVFLAFGTMIGYLVYSCTQTNFDLVSQEYYKDELAYQQVIDGANRANALSSKASLVRGDGSFTLRMPAEFQGKKVKGTVWFYCTAAAGKDRKVNFESFADAPVEIRQSLLPGNYTAKIGWYADDRYYYTEQSLSIH